MKLEAVCIETIHTISIDPFHEDSDILTKMASQGGMPQPKSSIRKETKTNVESATYKTLETIADVAG